MLDKPNTAKIDPITFEVIRNKLQAITEEQAITLKAVSGSPVVTEATDFNNGLYLNDGSIVTMGPQVIFHTGTMSTVIRSIIENFSENPGIKEGDMFILNDPYRGAIHQPDVSIVAPVFYQGRQVAWAGSCAHQLDVGGMSFGSWAIGATEIQQEAMLLPGVKLVEGGVLRQDLWQMIMGMTRLPHVLGLDLKAMIAANNVAARRLVELMDRYGADTVRMVMIEEINTSERQIRQTLSKLPDGVFRARDYIEHDGHSDILYQVCVTATKKGDSLTLDMTGTSPQAPGFHQLHSIRDARCRYDRPAPHTGAEHPLERRRHPRGSLRRAGRHSLQRVLAGSDFRRYHLGGMDCSERGRGSAFSDGCVLAGLRLRRAGRHQGPHDGDDVGRTRPRWRAVRNVPARLHRRRRRRLSGSRRARWFRRLLRAASCYRERGNK